MNDLCQDSERVQPMNYNDRRRLCEALGFTKTWMPLGTLVPTAPDWPPIDTDDTWARKALEAARDLGCIVRVWPCHNRGDTEPASLPSGGWWARHIGGEPLHAKDFPAASSAALLAALDAGALGGET